MKLKCKKNIMEKKKKIREVISKALEGILKTIVCYADGFPKSSNLINTDDGQIICSNCFSVLFSSSESDFINDKLKNKFLLKHEVKGNINENDDKNNDKHELLKKMRKPLPIQKHRIYRDKSKYDRKREKQKIYEAKKYAKEGFDVELECLVKKDFGYFIYDSNSEDFYNNDSQEEYKYKCSLCNMSTEDESFIDFHNFSKLTLEEELSRKELLEIIRKVGNEYVLYSKKKNPKTGKRRVLGRASTKEDILKRERQVQYFKHNK